MWLHEILRNHPIWIVSDVELMIVPVIRIHGAILEPLEPFLFKTHLAKRQKSHKIHGAAIYGVPWIPSIYPPMLAYGGAPAMARCRRLFVTVRPWVSPTMKRSVSVEEYSTWSFLGLIGGNRW